MENPIRRPWYRMHLLTFLAACAASVILFWLNIKGWNTTATHVETVDLGFGKAPATVEYEAISYGWPIQYMTLARDVDTGDPIYSLEHAQLSSSALIKDAAIAAALVIASLIFPEWLVRRRVARKGA